MLIILNNLHKINTKLNLFKSNYKRQQDLVLVLTQRTPENERKKSSKPQNQNKSGPSCLTENRFRYQNKACLSKVLLLLMSHLVLKVLNCDALFRHYISNGNVSLEQSFSLQRRKGFEMQDAELLF